MSQLSADNRGYLKVILGCMFSGKTSELIKEYKMVCMWF